MLESFTNFKMPPGSNHAQFNAVYLQYKELKDGLEGLDEIQYLTGNPAFRKVQSSRKGSWRRRARRRRVWTSTGSN